MTQDVAQRARKEHERHKGQSEETPGRCVPGLGTGGTSSGNLPYAVTNTYFETYSNGHFRPQRRRLGRPRRSRCLRHGLIAGGGNDAQASSLRLVGYFGSSRCPSGLPRPGYTMTGDRFVRLRTKPIPQKENRGCPWSGAPPRPTGS